MKREKLRASPAKFSPSQLKHAELANATLREGGQEERGRRKGRRSFAVSHADFLHLDAHLGCAAHKTSPLSEGFMTLISQAPTT